MMSWMWQMDEISFGLNLWLDSWLDNQWFFYAYVYM